MAAAEGATAPESLRQEGPRARETLWKAPATALATEGHRRGNLPGLIQANAGKALRSSDRGGKARQGRLRPALWPSRLWRLDDGRRASCASLERLARRPRRSD